MSNLELHWFTQIETTRNGSTWLSYYKHAAFGWDISLESDIYCGDCFASGKGMEQS